MIPTMKSLLLCSVVAVFACVTTVQAGGDCCEKSKASCSACKPVAKKANADVKGASLLIRK